ADGLHSVSFRTFAVACLALLS
ncbi:hypothetical protein Tco_0360171, partial [Tanacetum coccineum]